LAAKKKKKKTTTTRTRRPTARRRVASGSRRKAEPATTGRFPDVEDLVELMDRHGLLELVYESTADGSRHIRISRTSAPGVTHAAPAAPAPAAPATAAPSPAPATAPSEEPRDASLHAFTSPMVGTFYRAPSPEASPFVSVGDRVDEHGTVCIIEAMKVMNEIAPDVSGEIVSIEVENGEAVEYGQTLFLIRTT
jgi:acetyl-CoA carboxylase biotin carboxyl carrier protein